MSLNELTRTKMPLKFKKAFSLKDSRILKKLLDAKKYLCATNTGILCIGLDEEIKVGHTFCYVEYL